MRVRLEADFTQFYDRDLQDLWDPKERMTLRWVVVHAARLPPDSRVIMAVRKDNLTPDQHIALDTVDLLNQLRFFTLVNTQTKMKREEFAKVMKAAPKPIKRSNEPEVKEKPTFISGRQLKEMVRKTSSAGAIIHTDSCIRGMIYASSGKCDCPVVERSEK